MEPFAQAFFAGLFDLLKRDAKIVRRFVNHDGYQEELFLSVLAGFANKAVELLFL